MAQLKSVSVCRFRNVIESKIPVDQHTIVDGPNMTGKTNTLNAIHWAFTGRTLDGSNDNRANFTKDSDNQSYSVLLEFDTFTFKRACEMVDGTPTVKIYVDDKETTIKNGEAQLHAKLGLTDLILKQPKNFNIVSFLLNPLYFSTIDTTTLRKFFYILSGMDFKAIAAEEGKSVVKMLDKYQKTDPYELSTVIGGEKRKIKADVSVCEKAAAMFPSVKEEADKMKAKKEKELKSVEAAEALLQKYAVHVSQVVNTYYQNKMNIKVCVIEKGVGDDVYNDVCYPVLPNSELPFNAGSYAERSYVGMLFIKEVCSTWKINPLPMLVDNMESLDKNVMHWVLDAGIQFIGALVR